MHTIALFTGDGIGPEITDAARRVIEATGVQIEWVPLEGGEDARDKYGTPMPDGTLRSFLDIGVGFKGPYSVTLEDSPVTPEWRKGGSGRYRPKSYNSATNALRGEAGGYAAVRVAKHFEGVSAPIQGIDTVVVREISEDIYVASEYTTQNGTAVALKIITRQASERVINFAFEFAKTQGRRRLTVVHKANVLKQTDGLFVKVAREIAPRFPEIEYRELFIDAACALLIKDPQEFDVTVMPNQYGDIMSDLCASAAGSVGIGAGATFGTRAALFEPVHGTAPDIAGKGCANPVSQILSGALMLRHLGQHRAAWAIERAVEDTLRDSANHTPDLKGHASTESVTRAIIQGIAKHHV